MKNELPMSASPPTGESEPSVTAQDLAQLNLAQVNLAQVNLEPGAGLLAAETQGAVLRGSSAQHFGRLYAELSGTGPRESTYAAQRARMLLRTRQGLPKPRPAVWLWATALSPVALSPVAWGTALLGTAAVAAVALTLGLGADNLEAEWRGASVSSDTPLVTHEEEARLDFSDGSRIVLQPNGVAKLDRVSAKEAGVTLEEGSVVANIKKQTGVHWTIGAGPYLVHVVGTRFAVDWDKDDGHFRVAVTEGIVRVSGGNLPDDGIRLIAGAEFTRDSGVAHARKDANASDALPPTALPDPAALQDPTALQDPVAQEETAAQDAVPNSGALDPLAARETAEARNARRVAPEPSEPQPSLLEQPPSPPVEVVSWQTLANAADYRGALAAAEAAGFDALVQSGGVDDLLLLANSARYARSGQRAKQTYSAIRQRFPGSHASRLAAFYLARLAGDVEGQPRAEASWLKTYLTEAPGGELAASARARLMEVLRGLGDNAGATAIARDYLKFHAAGPHAEMARTLIRNSQERP